MKNWTRWHPPQKRLMTTAMIPWLTDSGSLTRRLKKHSQQGFSVHVLGNYWMKPLVDECLTLSIPVAQMAYQREVRLMDGRCANVYARTIIPLQTFRSFPNRFNGLGNKPLGEILFTDPSVYRGELEIARLYPGQCLYEMAVLEEDYRPDSLWARRSRFYIGGKVLLVNEIFLPTLLKSEG